MSSLVLPPPPSWFPGHMKKFFGMLPALLSRTDVVIEIRDSRLPLTSINPNLEGALTKWKLERGWNLNEKPRRAFDATPCQHFVVLNKRDLVPEWGVEPFQNAMTKRFPAQQTLFVTWKNPQAVRGIIRRLLDVAKSYPHSPELNVLVVGMPNVGKSTLLNALRNEGIQGPTPKAFKTSSQPGLTRALSTRIKLSQSPLVYAFDTPGVMLPYLGRGNFGAERGIKLSLIAGIKEGLYDVETQASYLLYRLNLLNPVSPSYLDILSEEHNEPIDDINEFLEAFASRRGMLKRGGELDLERAATEFIRWWRTSGAALDASTKLISHPSHQSEASPQKNLAPVAKGWGFDFNWSFERYPEADDDGHNRFVQARMEETIDEYVEMMRLSEESGENVSDTQRRKVVELEVKKERQRKMARKFQNKRDSSKGGKR